MRTVKNATGPNGCYLCLSAFVHRIYIHVRLCVASPSISLKASFVQFPRSSAAVHTMTDMGSEVKRTAVPAARQTVSQPPPNALPLLTGAFCCRSWNRNPLLLARAHCAPSARSSSSGHPANRTLFRSLSPRQQLRQRSLGHLPVRTAAITAPCALSPHRAVPTRALQPSLCRWRRSAASSRR